MKVSETWFPRLESVHYGAGNRLSDSSIFFENSQSISYVSTRGKGLFARLMVIIAILSSLT